MRGDAGDESTVGRARARTVSMVVKKQPSVSSRYGRESCCAACRRGGAVRTWGRKDGGWPEVIVEASAAGRALDDMGERKPGGLGVPVPEQCAAQVWGEVGTCNCPGAIGRRLATPAMLSRCSSLA
jgi:hypothetical protein